MRVVSARLAQLFVVGEEERLVVAVEQAGDDDRAADADARPGSASASALATPLRLLNQVLALSLSLR